MVKAVICSLDSMIEGPLLFQGIECKFGVPNSGELEPADRATESHRFFEGSCYKGTELEPLTVETLQKRGDSTAFLLPTVVGTRPRPQYCKQVHAEHRESARFKFADA